MNSSYFGGTFMIMRIFKPKAKRIETFNNLGDDEKDRIAKQITFALEETRISYRRTDFFSRDEWFFIRKKGRVVAAVALQSFKKVKKEKRIIDIYEIIDFININNGEYKATREELSQLFGEIVNYAKKSQKIDYLVYAIPKIDARLLVEIGFNAHLLNKTIYINAGIIDALLDRLAENIDKDYSNDEVFVLFNEELYHRNQCFNPNDIPKPLKNEIKVIQKNRRFLEKFSEYHPDKPIYPGLLVGLNVRSRK